MAQQQQAYGKQQERIAHLQRFIDRFKAKASKAKQAQSRMKRLAKLAGTEAVRVERGVSITLPVPARLSPKTPVMVNVSTVVVRSGTASPLATAFCKPIAAETSAIRAAEAARS